ncbi:MAG: ABC-type antimicrobial peptide transport system, permease component [Clostridia bacterium]|jgi:putative ABC transport system permease protein|nr:ABC-type antimicrobial peptide transport system, permease component [Clostridia bacterium]
MYIIKNAFKSITRSKTRNVLIGIIITVIAITCCIALSIKNSANEVEKSYLDSYKVTAQLSLDRGALRNDAKGGSTEKPADFDPKAFMSNVQNITPEDVMKYGVSDYVSSYLLSIQTNMDSTDLTKVTDTVATTDNKQIPGRVTSIMEGSSGDFRIIGYNSLDAMTQFISSTYKITDGEIFDIDSSNSCVISIELAEENSLKVGSTFKLNNPNNEAESYTFTVTGIYEDTSESGEFSMFSNSANQILTTYNTLNNIVTKSNEVEDSKLNIQTNATFNLVSADVVDAFTSELKVKGLSDYYTVSTNLESFNQSIAPLKNLSSFATTFLIIVLLIGGSILVILNMLNIRERKYEIGVLRAIGMKKRMVLSQFVIELLMVTSISIILGSTIGSVASVPVANYMLQSEISSQESAQTQVNENFGKGPGTNGGNQVRNNMMSIFGNNSNVDYIDKINAVVDIKIILELAGIGIILTIISSSISMIFISRYTPLKILSNRA